ncbi:MAG: hypothetical protein P4K83_03285 [Terracidiphilus sp.]|nr:hypothetical protein [Terracidiphilus sp.]
MKRFAAGCLFLLCAMPFSYGQRASGAQSERGTQSKADYPIQVHISGIHIRTHCGAVIRSCDDVLYADATLNGKKVDLMGTVVPIILGDYVARLQKKSPVSDVQEIGQKYEVLFPDHTYWRCTVTGSSE